MVVVQHGSVFSRISTLLYGLKDNKLEYIKTGYDKVISNIKNLQDDGYKTLLAAVINPSMFDHDFHLTTSIDLDIKIKEAIEFKFCDIRLSVIALEDTNEIIWSPGWYTKGSFTDNVFYGQINTDKQGGNATGTIRVELEDNLNIRSLSVMANHSDQYSSSQWGFTANGIPHTENEPYLLVYSHSGTTVCSYVNNITGKYWMPDGSIDEVKLLKCDSESLLHIKFHNYE